MGVVLRCEVEVVNNGQRFVIGRPEVRLVIERAEVLFVIGGAEVLFPIGGMCRR
jgi:hypothetical protein